MGLAIKAALGALVVLLIGVLAKTKNYYIAGLIPLFPTFALIAHYIVASERGTEALRTTIVFGMWSIIPYFLYLLSLWYFTGFLRLPLALGGAVVGWVLGMVDYAPGQATQSPGVLSTINALFTLIPCALFLCMVALLAIYKLNSRLVDSIARELASKREVRPEAGQLSPATPSALQE